MVREFISQDWRSLIDKLAASFPVINIMLVRQKTIMHSLIIHIYKNVVKKATNKDHLGNQFLLGIHITPFILHLSLSDIGCLGMEWEAMEEEGNLNHLLATMYYSLSSVLLFGRWMLSPLSLFPFSTSLKKPKFLRTTSMLKLPYWLNKAPNDLENSWLVHPKRLSND